LHSALFFVLFSGCSFLNFLKAVKILYEICFFFENSIIRLLLSLIFYV